MFIPQISRSTSYKVKVTRPHRAYHRCIVWSVIHLDWAERCGRLASVVMNNGAYDREEDREQQRAAVYDTQANVQARHDMAAHTSCH